MNNRKVTMQGHELQLTGSAIHIGDKVRDFTVVTNELKPYSLNDTGDGLKVFVTVPSLDTPVCDTEARKFNEEAPKLGKNVSIYVISMDLPFAQARWCGAAGIDNVITLSDYQAASFGETYGVLIDGLRLLARAVFIVKDGEIKYYQLVPEITDEPDYDEVIEKIEALS